MVIRLLQIITEYIGIILCLHTFAKVKKEVNRYNVLFGIVDVIILLYIDKYAPKNMLFMFAVYFLFLIYVKIRLENRWSRAVKTWGCMLVMMPSLQLSIYFLLKSIIKTSMSAMTVSIMVNIFICMFFGLWNEKLISIFIMKVKEKIGIILSICFMIAVLFLFSLYKKNEVLEAEVILLIACGIWGILLFWVLYFTSERERMLKERELQLYKIYNKSFEDTINTIRQRQHEFDNHINAIRCMQYSIDNEVELRKAQSSYCDQILKENAINGLLKIDIDPIIIGVLYSKLMVAQTENIIVQQKIQAINYEKRVELVELIEILGILIDNAIEALKDNNSLQKLLKVQMLVEDEKHFSIEIANSSLKIPNSIIEKFCKNGYSTKGENRGMGLPRVLDIVKKNNADIRMENVSYGGINFFSIKIII